MKNTKKVIKGWGVIQKDRLMASWGCTCSLKKGVWRYPVFYNRKDANKWMAAQHLKELEIIPCEISYLVKKTK